MALLPKDPRKQLYVLIGLIPLVLAFLYYQFYHTTRVAEVEILEEQVETLQAGNAAAQAIVASYGTDLPRRLAIYEEHIRQLEELLPRREDVPMLIDLITEQAQILGIQLTALKPSIEEPGEFYSRQSYELNVLGDYHSVGEYLTAIGSLPRIVRSQGVALSVSNAPPKRDGTPQLIASFKIQTYIMPAPPARLDQ
jgi:type IV pilus assembly protein PilO